MTATLLGLVLALLLAIQQPNVPQALRIQAINVAQEVLAQIASSTPAVIVNPIVIAPTTSSATTMTQQDIPSFGNVETKPAQVVIAVEATSTPHVPTANEIETAYEATLPFVQGQYDNCLANTLSTGATDNPDLRAYRAQHYCFQWINQLIELGGVL